MLKKILWSDKWISVHQLDFPKEDGTTQPYTSVKDGTGCSVAILPFRYEEGGLEILVRHELIPPWNMGHNTNRLVMSCVTGDLEDTELPHMGALREVFEETGYGKEDLSKYLHFCGIFRGSKLLENEVYGFVLDLTGVDNISTPEGDGTFFEDQAHNEWVKTPKGSPDAILWALWCSLQGE
jgi:8-oxo-dGTP pyrophosphatase MutT (NUDIX family)